jgi:hypothetical protein
MWETSVNEYVQAMFGINVRHITFKKMAIVFLIEDDVVYIQLVISVAYSLNNK